MKLEFNSIEEVKEFHAQLKGKRNAKGGEDDGPAGTAPAPLMPQGATGFGGPTPGPFSPSAPAAAGFGGPSPFAPSGVAPEVVAIVARISAVLDAQAAKGQPLDQALGWFRQQCGPEAAAATMDQIKASFLPRMSMPALENIVKLMGA